MILEVLPIKSLEKLEKELRRYDIPMDTGWQKTRQQLLGQIKAGECVLVDRRGELVRYVWRAKVNVYRRTHGGRLQRLVEVERIVNGESCSPSKGPSVSEKMWALKGETALQAIVRGLKEELGITVDASSLRFLKEFAEPLKETKTFPIRCINYVHLYALILPYDSTVEEYKEIQDRKITRWAWKRTRRRVLECAKGPRAIVGLSAFVSYFFAPFFAPS